MSKYTVTKHEYSLDVIEHLIITHVAFMCSIWEDMGEYTYYTADDDEVKSGAKKEGDVKAEVQPEGWKQEDYNWDDELQRVFGEVDADLKKSLQTTFTSDVKAKVPSMDER